MTGCRAEVKAGQVHQGQAGRWVGGGAVAMFQVANCCIHRCDITVRLFRRFHPLTSATKVEPEVLFSPSARLQYTCFYGADVHLGDAQNTCNTREREERKIP